MFHFYRFSGIVVLSLFCLTAFTACGGKGAPSIDLIEREIDLGRHVVTGMMPDWPEHPYGNGLALSEDFEMFSDVVKMSVRFFAHGGTGFDRERLMEEIHSKKETEMEIGVPEVVKDISEIRPGVWSFVVMREGFTMEGEREYTIHALHLPDADDEDGLVGFLCDAQARFDYADAWEQLETILAEVSFREK